MKETRAEYSRRLANDPSVSLDYYKYAMSVYDFREREENEKRIEALELVASFAKDVVDCWPTMSFRTIKTMAVKIEALVEALKLLER